MVEDQFSGQSGQCVTCGRGIQLPEFASTADAPGRTRGVRLARWVVAALVAVMIVGSVAVATLRYGSQGIGVMQENRMRAQSMRNLEKIGNALNAYARDYGSYPPPVTIGENGVPMHSWRVLVLPYLGHQELYDRFDLDQPWDAMENQLLVDEMPAEYRSPALNAVRGRETHYVLITGAGTLFPTTGPHGPSHVTDDPAKTLLVVDSSRLLATGMPWMGPMDLDISQMSMTIGTDIGGNHRGGATAVMVDGNAHFLSESLEPAVVRALITPRGGEGLPDDVLD